MIDFSPVVQNKNEAMLPEITHRYNTLMNIFLYTLIVFTLYTCTVTVTICTRGLILFELHTCLVIMANMEFERNRNPNQLLVRLVK